MAIFHLSLSLIKRSTGRSSVAAAAYRAAERLQDERTGEVHDYRRKSLVDEAFILTPAGAPAWTSDRATLWNAVETKEKRKDAQVARECELALPRELSPAEQKKLVDSFAQKEFVDRGMIADIAIHRPLGSDGDEQPHAHVLLTTRLVSKEGFGSKVRAWNDQALAEGWREAWADSVNATFPSLNIDERIDHRSYRRQGKKMEPSAHMGPHVTQMERRARRRAKRTKIPYRPVSRIGKENALRQRRNSLRLMNIQTAHQAKRTIEASMKAFTGLMTALSSPNDKEADQAHHNRHHNHQQKGPTR